LWTVAIPNAYSDPCQNENGGMLCLVNRSKAVCFEMCNLIPELT
jgi:hypothetical protein